MPKKSKRQISHGTSPDTQEVKIEAAVNGKLIGEVSGARL